MRFTKFTANLFATIMMASMVMLPETTYGAGQAASQAKARAEAQAARNMAVANTQVRGLQTYVNALMNPVPLLNAAAAPGNIPRICADAVADAASAANGRVNANIEDKLLILNALEGAPAGHDDRYKTAIRTALGLDPTPVNAHAEVDKFIVDTYFNEVVYPRVRTTIGAVVGRNEAAQVRTILARLSVGTHNAAGGALLAPGAPPVDINAALTRLGL